MRLWLACSVKAVLKSIIESECEENTAYTGNGFISLRTSVWWAKTALLQRNLAEHNKIQPQTKWQQVTRI
jgi:hypothetical protein